MFNYSFRGFTKFSRIKLNEFYKKVHPDVIGSQVPTQIRITNSNSLQQVHQYLDSVESEQRTQELDLQFYIKTEQDYELKSLILEQFTPEVQNKQKLLNQAVNALQKLVDIQAKEEIDKQEMYVEEIKK